MSIRKYDFGELSTGEKTHLFVIENKNGNLVKITDFGGALVSIIIADEHGIDRDVICGFDNVTSYEKAGGYLGALVGRVCNRIANGRFVCDGKEYKLYCNDGANHLHGGKVGYSHRVWGSDIVDDKLVLTLFSPDGDEGYPGNVDIKVTYEFTDDNELKINYSAKTDKKTPLSLTNHAYFNLNGFDGDLIDNHKLYINAPHYIPVNKQLIPTGEIKPVAFTPFDFTFGCVMENALYSRNEEIKANKGIDHCYCFAENAINEKRPQCELYSPDTGIVMCVYTDRPCVQCYTANFLDDEKFPLKNGIPQRRHGAVCLETEAMPDSPNHEGFTDIFVNAGQSFESFTTYKFGIINNSDLI